MMRSAYLTFLSLLFSSLLFSQENPENQRDDAVNIFIDCSSWQCDMDYIKNNMTMVNYMRTVQDADVYILVVTQRTGSGGQEYNLQIEGQDRFEGQKNELKFNTDPTNTDDEIRIKLVKNLRAGLMPFIAQTSLFEKIDITYEAPNSAEEPEEVKDIWNNWVYSISMNGWLNGQSSYKSLNMFGNVSARRVTEDWKISLSVNANLDRNKFKTGEKENGDPIFDTYETSGYGFYSYAIRAINEHWSTGVNYSLNSSTFRNINLSNNLTAAIEYNIFPYKEATKKQLRISYRPGFRHNNYVDTTLYNKKSEALGLHRLGIAYETQAKWGSIDFSVFASQYLHDLGLYNIRVYTGLNFRVAKGLTLNLSGNLGYIRDQIALPKGDASDEDILLQQRELQTNYSYWANFGIRYSFGSIYNNVVFPRFGGSL